MEDQDRELPSYSVASQQHLLLKLQKAFCMCQFSQSEHLVKEAVCVLDRMDPATGYPKIIGYHLARDLLSDCNGTLPRCKNIYNSVSVSDGQ